MNIRSFLLRCASVLFLVLVSTNRAFAGAGDLDTSFGVNGITPSEPGNTIAIIVQPDGKIVSLASNSGSYWLARYGSTGNLDVSFHGTGKVTIGLNGTSIALQADGKILVVGGTSPAGGILRYNPDGSVDTTFNGTGQVATDLVRSIAVQSDGKIVVSGPVSSGASAAFGVGRYNANGSLDMSFNGTGKATVPVEYAYLRSMAIQSDGKIVVAGVMWDRFIVIRVNSNGSLDTSWNGTGKATAYVSGVFSPRAVDCMIALDGSGRTVLAGWGGTNYNNDSVLNLRRFNTNGTTDNTFRPDWGGVPTAIAIQASGKIVVGGAFYTGNLIRFNANGTEDYSFNTSVPTLFGPNAIAIQPDQKIVTSGYYGYFADFSIARLAGLNVPVVAPGIATNLSPTSVTLNATVNPSGLPTTVQFEYGTTTAHGNIVPVTISPNAETSALRVSAALSGLAPATAYHWRLVATNSEGTTTISDRVFVSGVAPDVAPGAPFGLTQTSFTMAGTINPRGFAATAQFQYGTTTAYGNNVEIALSPDDGTVNQSVSAALSNLAPATTYHWRIVAMNAHGSNQTTDQAFTTPAFTGAQPLVTASAVSGVTKTAATLGGTVNANGFATTAQFEYGTTIAYGSSTTATLSQNNGVTAQTVSAALSNLLPGRVYHWRIVAVNANGTSTTADQTFTTQALIGDWKLTHLGDENAPDNGDPDGDGLSTFAEYGLCTLPQSPSNPLAVTSFNYGDGTRLRTYIQRDPTHSDVTVKVLASSSLAGPWTTVAISSFGAQFTGPGYVNGDNSAPGVKTIEVRDIATIETSPVRCMRVQVSR